MSACFRVRDHGCHHAGTYKYYLPSESVASAWRELSEAFGPCVEEASYQRGR